MIYKEEIDDLAARYGLTPQSVEKDYVFGWLIQGIYTQSRLGSLFILKGGNALRKAYLEETRFSQDLDFSLTDEIDRVFLLEELQAVLRYVSDRTGVSFELDRTDVRGKRLPQELTSDALEVRTYFKGFYGEENISLKAQLDVTQFDKVILPIQSRNLIHPYSDAIDCQAVVRTQKAEEILASKLTCLLHRGKPADLYDLAKMLVFENPYKANRLEVIRTFLAKSAYEADHVTAKTHLLGVSLEKYHSAWSQFAVPILASLSFELIRLQFPKMIEDLFSVLLPPLSALATAHMPGSMATTSFRGSSSDPRYFASGFRETIISAGRSRTMIEMTYDGLPRFVEPYAMAYRVRKSDGKGAEYFWGYDTTGGKSGKKTLKTFFCEKLKAVKPTTRSFTPRYDVEL